MPDCDQPSTSLQHGLNNPGAGAAVVWSIRRPHGGDGVPSHDKLPLIVLVLAPGVDNAVQLMVEREVPSLLWVVAARHGLASSLASAAAGFRNVSMR